MWVIRKGVPGTGRNVGAYLWAAERIPDPSAWGIGTARGGTWQTPNRELQAWWETSQRGALRYSKRDEAWRVAYQVGGRVVRLRPTQATGGK